MDDLAQRLQAIPGCESLSVGQLERCSFATRERVFVALFRRACGPSNYGAILRACASARRRGRVAQSAQAAEAAEREFQTMFARLVAKEIGRLGGSGAVADADALRSDPSAAFSAFDFLLERIGASSGACLQGTMTF